MSSAELEGFSVWAEWNSGTVKHAPMKPGVYVFRLSRTEPIRRLMLIRLFQQAPSGSIRAATSISENLARVPIDVR